MSGTTVGVFRSPGSARNAIARLREQGYEDDRITILMPGASTEEVATTDTEQAGMGPALAGAIGGALSIGLGLALFVPGVGPITLAGALATGLLGAGGAAASAAVGAKLEGASLTGLLPADELYVYEDALRKGRTVVLVSDAGEPEEAWRVLQEAGAESIDAAKDDWWVGIRDAEELEYAGDGVASGQETRDKALFSRGFETATRLLSHGKSEKEAEDLIQEEYPDLCSEPLFVRGTKRGFVEWRRRESNEPIPSRETP